MLVAEATVSASAPLLCSANDCLDVGIAPGSPVSLDYYDNVPFKFNGKIENVHVKYTKHIEDNFYWRVATGYENRHPSFR